MAKIFISYRREDTGGHARHLFEELARRYGEKNVFMDVATLEGGERWTDRIDEEVARSDAFIVLIGRRWLDARDADGNRRLDRPGDYVRREVASGLARDTVTIPVLVDGAAMPPEEELPDEIDDLVRRNAVELSSARWDYELERLLELLPPPPRRWLVRAAVGLAAALVLAVAAYLVWRSLDTPPMSAIFNVGVLDFGERTDPEAPIESSKEGRWIADWVHARVADVQAALESDADMQGVVAVERIEETPEGATALEVEASLSELAAGLDATLLLYGVLDLSGSPYRFTPSLYLTQEFKGGEELSGESTFGRPIRVTLPLDETGAGRRNRHQLVEDLRHRFEALHLFTLGLAYLQIERPARALDLFDRAAAVEGWEARREVLHLFRGSALMLLGRLLEARDAYARALEEGGAGYGRAHLGLGNVFEAQGRVDRALDQYRQALAAEPSSPLGHVRTKARLNLGLTLASLARSQNAACDSPDAEDAREALAGVVEDHRAAPDNDVLRELAFKAEYQRGVLALACGDVREESPEAARAYREALEPLRAAVELGEPQAVKGEPGTFGERRWQRDRWTAWQSLGYVQLRLAELGAPELREQAVASLERVTARYERSEEEELEQEVPEEVAADAFGLLARALEASDPAAAERYRERGEEIEAAASL